MSVRALLLGVVALAGLVAAPSARAGDFDKYLPANSEFYMHVSVPKFFTSEMVRKVVPMMFDKYGDQMVMFAGMAKQFNPQMPDVPEDQLKDAMKNMADPQQIAKAFDAAKNKVTDIVIAGVPPEQRGGDRPNAVILVKCSAFTAEGADMVANMMAAFPQAGVIEPIKKAGGTVYSYSPPQQDQKVYITVPERGILHIAMTEELAEASFAPKGAPTAELAARMTKRGAGDFVFVAATGNADAPFTAGSFNLTLDKDISARFDVDYKEESKAAERAKEANERLSDFMDQIKERLGDKGEGLKNSLAKTKATADGKKFSANMTLPGAAVEELLKKEKE